MRLLVLCDPQQTLAVETDTTVAIAGELAGRGHEVQLSTPSALTFADGHVRADGVEVAAFDAVLVRVDPPVDEAYLHMTQLLDLVGPQTFMVNAPAGLRAANEKLFILGFADLIPETIVSASLRELRSFVDRAGTAVVKPLDGCGGRGVVHLRRDDPGVSAVLELLTATGTRLVTAQQFLPEVKLGDKRIFLLDGQPMGALDRVPCPGELRANLHVGGRAAATRLTARDLEISREVGERCLDLGIRFAGIDVIAGHLTEVNVTSPTGFRELASVGGPRLERVFADWLQAAVDRQEVLV
jgi:glutathione synthase